MARMAKMDNHTILVLAEVKMLKMVHMDVEMGVFKKKETRVVMEEMEAVVQKEEMEQMDKMERTQEVCIYMQTMSKMDNNVS